MAHLPGLGSSFWRTDLVLINPQSHPVEGTARFLPTGRDNAAAARAVATLAPGQKLQVPDVLSRSEFQNQGKLGALLVYAEGPGPCTGDACNVLVLSRTYNSSATTWALRANDWLPGVPPASALRAGDKTVFSHVTKTTSVGASVGCASWSNAAVQVRVRVFDAAGTVLESRSLELPRFGHLHVPLDADVSDGRLEFEVIGPKGRALVVPYVSMVDRTSGLPTYLLPDALPAHKPAGQPPLPADPAGR